MDTPAPLRVILAGCGGTSAGWLKAIEDHPDLEAVALVDIDPEQAQKRAAQFDLEGILIETDLERALAAARPDLVFDCTIPAAHLSVTLAALRHDCHVLGEKPLSDSMENARHAVAAAREAGRIYAVNQNRRYNAQMRRLKAFLDTGAIGAVTTVYHDFYMGSRFGGFRAEMEHLLLLDMAIHAFDAARFLLGGAEARTVSCHEWNPPGATQGHGLAAEAVFEMAGSIVFSYRGNWAAEGRQTNWDGSWHIVGTNGAATWDGVDTLAAAVPVESENFPRPQQPVKIPALDSPEDSFGRASVVGDFVQAVRGGTLPETVCTDNIKSLAMVFAAIESAQQGKRVPVSAE